jgi:hypothetical protein
MGGDARASSIPCPMLSILVTEGLLGADQAGSVSLADLQRALQAVGLSPVQGFLLSHGASSSLNGDLNARINLFELAGGPLDHKGSLGPLQNGGFNPSRLDALLECSTDGETLTLQDLAAAEDRRMRADGGGLRDRLLGAVELSALLLIFGKPNKAGVLALALKDVVTIFKDNKLPVGFQAPHLSSVELGLNMARLALIQEATR